MLLLGMADGGISILRLNRPLLLSLQPGRHLAARSPSSHSDLASANECRPGFARLHRSLRSGFFVVPPYLFSHPPAPTGTALEV